MQRRRLGMFIALLTVFAVIIITSITRLDRTNTGGMDPEARDSNQAAKLELLQQYLTGRFSSEEQAAEMPEDYHNISLVMVPVWEQREDGPWLYVEQSIAERADVPYRQRLYRLRIGKTGDLISEVYTLPGDPLDYAGAHKNPELLAGLTPDSLSFRDGCAVYLQWNEDGSFSGGTRGEGCESRLPGATYATSEVVITDSSFTSWDRGFNDEGEQVWGAEKGGYVFKKVRTEPPEAEAQQ
ncbi:hypothetical protein GF324_08175 [bacterium]|nr:hypothetical protein [bacterium]